MASDAAPGAAPIPGLVISLARRPDRRERFLKWNSGKGIEISVFDAVDGQTLSKPQLLRTNLIDDDNINFSQGHLGAAMSHRALWEKCIELAHPILIFEDDVYLPDGLKDWIGQVHEELTGGCDILYLGYNRDAILSIGYGGSGWCNVVFDRPPSGFEYEARQHSRWSNARTHAILDTRLVWGVTAYAISPSGAQSLLNSCFPLSNKLPVRMFGTGRMLVPYSIDGMVNLATQRGLIKARVVFPPLVIGPNDPGDSDNNPRPG